MKRQIVGVEHIRCDDCSIFYISNLSDDLKAVIRSCIASVCHGAAKASTGRPMYCYKTTLSEFIRRYREKNASILKRERYYGKRFASREELVQMIENYITYYNNRRVQRNLGVLTPMEKHNSYPLAA